MRIGIIAEGFADVAVIKAIVKKLLGLDGAALRVLRPKEALDETDLKAMNFSNWGLVLESCKDEKLLGAFFDEIEDDAMLIVHIDTAERGQEEYDVNEPARTGNMDYTEYANTVCANVRQKIESLISEPYRDRIAYAIAVEETDAWLIPLFDNRAGDTASHVRAKETLERLIGSNKKSSKAYVDTGRKSLDYVKLGKELSKGLVNCRRRNRSLDLFCIEVEQKMIEN